ncbi:aminoacyl-tRNA hydrolase [Tepidimicrobium xylanilyticum]|uniref:aminoacyl-tRNA hydrolase n=1 Tax=Tepidimicrobium xylanilyticum TaxID=1123352 RepID=UPI000B88B72C|nr:aminoacyl-tRNA hydrolase [Tepidimicrobium xylanilyticum]GMG97558.1 peptidyl-tRNA hydrolase [Tepidimicrobium xylanilyticum]
MFAIIGLGNPGKAYANTRHNVGFNAIDLLASRNNIKINKIKFKSVCGEGIIAGKKVLLMKPHTYMNNSGMAVLDLYNFYKLPTENIIVVVDDIDIEFGTIRIKKKGSAGSHNGLKSIIYHLQTENFPRIKIGIGNKKEGQDLADFVLSQFTKDERVDIDQAIEKAALAVETILQYDIDKAMNEFNRRENKPRN